MTTYLIRFILKTATVENKKTFVLFISLLIVCASVQMSSVAHAQQSAPTTDISSDLSLDLGLAQQNPAPEQKAIVASQTQQATTVTITGETNTIVPQDVISSQAKTESQENAVNPDQTTSEQVITRPVTVQVDQNGTPTPEQPSPTSGDVNSPSSTNQNNNLNGPDTNNLVPGTNVVAPDDNSAPSDNSGNPDLPAPTPTDSGSLNAVPNNQVNPSSAPDNSGSSSQPSSSGGSGGNQSQQSVPLESQPAVSSPSDSGSQPADSGSGSSDTTTPPDGATVEGTSTGPEGNIFQRAITNITDFLTGK